MSADLAQERAIASAPANSLQSRSTLMQASWLCLMTLLATLVIEHATLSSMVSLWSRSQTFAHGFLIAPISAMLVWRQRQQLRHLPLGINMYGVLCLAALAGAWLLANVADVQVVSQYCVVLMISAIVLAMMGWQVTRALAFPLAYLLLAVPFGEVLIPALIDFTARFTVAALQLTGVPVFQENNFISIPSGNWSVVDACSGLRYVISSMALGTLYAYLNFHSLLRRLIFIAVALVLPVFANGIRAYSIVMIGHWSDMRLAVGVDHLIYGWLFFGLVSLLLFWIASFWRDQEKPSVSRSGRLNSAEMSTPTTAVMAVTALACLAITGTTVAIAHALNDSMAPALGTSEQTATAFGVPAQPGWTATTSTAPLWQAPHAGKPRQFMQNYENAHGVVGLQLVWYARQNKGAQLLTVANDPLDHQRNTQTNIQADTQANTQADTLVNKQLDDQPNTRWQLLDRNSNTISLELPGTVQQPARQLSINQSILRFDSSRLLVWRWYRQSQVDTGSAMLVKFLLAKSKILRQPEDGAEIILSARFEEGAAPPVALLQVFTTNMLPAIDKELNDVAHRHAGNR